MDHNLFGWLVLVVNDRKFPAETVFFSHINQTTVIFHEPATKQTRQPNGLPIYRQVFPSISFEFEIGANPTCVTCPRRSLWNRYFW